EVRQNNMPVPTADQNAFFCGANPLAPPPAFWIGDISLHGVRCTDVAELVAPGGYSRAWDACLMAAARTVGPSPKVTGFYSFETTMTIPAMQTLCCAPPDPPPAAGADPI